MDLPFFSGAADFIGCDTHAVLLFLIAFPHLNRVARTLRRSEIGRSSAAQSCLVADKFGAAFDCDIDSAREKTAFRASH